MLSRKSSLIFLFLLMKGIFLFADEESIFDYSIITFFGIKNGSVNELVYENENQISKLVWDQSMSPQFGIDINFKGSPTISTELAFRVIAEQLPVEFNKATSSGVNILLTYVAALYVAPKNAAPKLVLADARGTEKDGKLGLQITIKNVGTAHALISNPKIVINKEGDSAPIEFSGEALSSLDGQNLLANSERIIFVPWEDAIPNRVYSGTLSAEIES